MNRLSLTFYQQIMNKIYAYLYEKKNCVKHLKKRLKFRVSDNFMHKQTIWRKDYDELARFPVLRESLACI